MQIIAKRVHAQSIVLLNGEMATASIWFRKFKFWLWKLSTLQTNWLFQDFFY